MKRLSHMGTFDSSRGGLAPLLTGALLLMICKPVSAGLFDNSEPVPQWGLDAANTPTPAYAKDSGSVILYDEYVETGGCAGPRGGART